MINQFAGKECMMNTKTKRADQSLIQFKNRAGAGVFALMLLLPVVSQGGGVVTNCTEANLRSAMVGGGAVTFACDGTITLASTITNAADAVLDGAGHQITISGGNAVRVFYVTTNVTFTLANLRIANGRSEFGGGIYNEGGTVNLLGTIWQTNVALDEGGRGGALFNWGGVINATNCEFLGNVAQSMTNSLAENAGGGAVFNFDGLVNLQNCVFNANRASAALESGYPESKPGMTGADGCGGAIYNLGSLKINSCTFRDNSAGGGMGGVGYHGGTWPPNYDGSPAPLWGGNGGDGYGGAVFSTGLLLVDGSLFVGNLVTGGSGGFGGGGGSGLYGATSGGFGGRGGSGFGAALFTSGGVSQIGNCTVVSNTGAGGIGGTGSKGGNATKGNGASGGNGGTGGRGIGAINASDDCRSTNCTIAFNSGIAGNGGSGGVGGLGNGGGSNGPAGPNGINGVAGGGGITGGTCVNTLLATNTPGGNGYGSISDLGHNLSSDGSCNFTNAGSLNNTDPKLGPLADNGGPTMTMALLPRSPAIDAGDNAAAPPTDQRGIPRPVGSFSDIGAYEFTAVLQISRALENKVKVLVYGSSGQSCRLLTSTNLSDWQCVATNQIGPDGTVRFQDNCGTGAIQRFYKVALP